MTEGSERLERDVGGGRRGGGRGPGPSHHIPAGSSSLPSCLTQFLVTVFHLLRLVRVKWSGERNRRRTTRDSERRLEVAERYTSLYARLTYGPSVLCSSRVALRVPLRSRLRRVRWGEIENEWVTRSEGTSERSTHRCALSLTVHPSVTRHSVRPLVPRLLTSFLVPTVWRVEDVRSRGGRTEHRPDENRRNDWDTSPTVPAVYRSLRSLPSLLTSLHSCRSLMLHSLRLVPLVRWG